MLLSNGIRSRTIFAILVVVALVSGFDPLSQHHGEARAQAPGVKPSIQNDPAYKQFIGNDGSRFWGADPKFATDVANTVLNYPGITYDLPLKEGKQRCCVDISGFSGASLIDGTDFEQLMIAAVEPDAQSKNQFVRLTAGLLPQLESKILASNGGLTPADIMRMSLDVSRGNYPIASLIAHNFLKNIAYKGRQAVTKFGPMIALGKNPALFRFPPGIGAVAAKLANMRTKPGDKMGIWYHSFVPLTIAVWTCHENSADRAILEEYLVRSLGSLTNMGSPMDPEKKKSDEQFAEASHSIFDKRRAKPTLIVCNASVTPEKGSMETKFVLKLKYQVVNLPVEANPVIEEEMQVTAKDYSKEVRKNNKEVVMAQSRHVEIEIPFEPETEGKHNFEFSLRGGLGFANTTGSVPFEVGTATVTGWSTGKAPEVEFHSGVGEVATYTLDPKTNTCSITSPKMGRSSGQMGTMVLKYVPPPASLKVGQIFEVGGSLTGIDDGTYGGFGISYSEPMSCFQTPDISAPYQPMSIGTLNGERQLYRKVMFGQKLPGPGQQATPPKAPNPTLMMQIDDQNNAYLKLRWKFQYR